MQGVVSNMGEEKPRYFKYFEIQRKQINLSTYRLCQVIKDTEQGYNISPIEEHFN